MVHLALLIMLEDRQQTQDQDHLLRLVQLVNQFSMTYNQELRILQNQQIPYYNH